MGVPHHLVTKNLVSWFLVCRMFWGFLVSGFKCVFWFPGVSQTIPNAHFGYWDFARLPGPQGIPHPFFPILVTRDFPPSFVHLFGPHCSCFVHSFVPWIPSSSSCSLAWGVFIIMYCSMCCNMHPGPSRGRSPPLKK